MYDKIHILHAWVQIASSRRSVLPDRGVTARHGHRFRSAVCYSPAAYELRYHLHGRTGIVPLGSDACSDAASVPLGLVAERR